MAKPSVAAQADFGHSIHGDLTALLYLQGYRAEADFVTSLTPLRTERLILPEVGGR